MFIGKISNVGGKNGLGHFGFIMPMGSMDYRGVFFHFSDIRKDSNLSKCIANGSWRNAIVAYEINDQNSNPDHNRAKNIMLIKEIDEKSLFESIDKEQEKKKDVDLFLRINYPDEYFDQEIDKYFNHFSEESVRELFYARYADNWFGRTFCRDYIHFTENNRYLYWGEDVCGRLDLSEEKHEDIEELTLHLEKKHADITCLLRKYTFLLMNDKIIESLTTDQIKLLIEDMNANDRDALLSRIASSTNDKSILRYIIKNISEECICQNERLISCLTDSELKAIVEHIDWLNDSPPNIEQYKGILKIIEADDFPQAAVAIATSTLEQNAIMPEHWWACFTESVKVRIIIYLSTFLAKYDLHNHISRIHEYEVKEGNKLLEAILLFVSVYYCNTDTEKQQRFQKAHEKLEEYIVSSFNNQIYISKGLDTLLDKCKKCAPTDRVYYCDAKPWENRDGFYCSEGLGHYNERKPCSQYDHLDYKKTLYQNTKQYEDQHFQELLLNVGFVPDIRWIKYSKKYKYEDGYEYAFLIAGYVNRLIDMETHMRCRCGSHFIANYEYTKKNTPRISRTRFICPQRNDTEKTDHDPEVYLNYCICCSRVIDSRECRITDEKGYWLCMYCGGSYSYKYEGRPLQCPNCGTTNQEMLYLSKIKIITCKQCRHNINKEHPWRLFADDADAKNLLPSYNGNTDEEKTYELPFYLWE